MYPELLSLADVHHTPPPSPKTSWPRTSTERLLMDLFDCHAAQLLAVIEALRDTSRRPLQTGPPQDPDDQEVVLELLSAGASILGGTCPAWANLQTHTRPFSANRAQAWLCFFVLCHII